MSGQWKPGDVAMVTDVTGEVRPMILIGHDPANRCWHGAMSNGDIRCLLAGQEQDARPLLVIDPEDREQIIRLTDALSRFEIVSEGWDEGPRYRRASDALRSLLTPPKPDEPQGRGAVVLDSVGIEWVRVHPGGDAWVNGYQRWAPYAGIDAVEVLSEGVAP